MQHAILKPWVCVHWGFCDFVRAKCMRWICCSTLKEDTKGETDSVSKKRKKKDPDKDTQVKQRWEKCSILSIPKIGTWVRQSPYPNIYGLRLVFSTHLILNPFITTVCDSHSNSFILRLLSTLYHLSVLPCLCWLSILFTAKSSLLLPDREPISITKGLLCEGPWGSQLTRASLPDTDLSSSYCMCHRQKRTNLNKGDTLACHSSRRNSWKWTWRWQWFTFSSNMFDRVTHLRGCNKSERKACIIQHKSG